MPSGNRVRANSVFGTVADNPLIAGATSFNSNQLVLLPSITSGHAVITLDPLRQYGNPEIVVVTGHSPASTVGTITRGAYGTTAREHPFGTVWVHALTAEDTLEVLTSSTRPADPYQGQMIYETDTDSYVARAAGAVWQTVMPLGQWTSYTPTWMQGTEVSKTITYSRYVKLGRTVIFECLLVATGAGSAGPILTVSLPVPAVQFGVTGVAKMPIGTGQFFDASTSGTNYSDLVANTASTVSMVDINVGTSVPTVTIASGDAVKVFAIYEGAS